MEFIKNIARKILSDEIKELKEKLKKEESKRIELDEILSKIENRHEDKLLEERKKKYEAVKRAGELEKENEVLRKYYDLNKEPSDEIKAKIHIDLEINRLKEKKDDLKNEILKIITTRNQPIYTQSYYGYPFYGQRF